MSVIGKLRRLLAFPGAASAELAAIRAVCQEQATRNTRLEHEIKALQEKLPEFQSITGNNTQRLLETLEAKTAEIYSFSESKIQQLLEAVRGLARDINEFSESKTQQIFEILRRELSAADNKAYILSLMEMANHLQNKLDTMNDIVQKQAIEIDRLRQTLALQSTLLPSWFWDESANSRVRQILRPLRPYDVDCFAKIRLGRPYDGGYVMIDDLEAVNACLSLGINDDVSLDLDLANRNIPIYQYDHTISKLPEEHPHFHFIPQKIAPYDGDGCVSLDTLIGQRLADGQTDLILKIDIENDEWEVFNTADPGLLARFRQIICEFHQLHRLGEAAFGNLAETVFKKLHTQFFVCHVHANNCGNLANVANIAIPESLEVTFANRQRYASLPSSALFPTPLDMPNQEGRADIFLGSFQF
jgi:hypothetical protein